MEYYYWLKFWSSAFNMYWTCTLNQSWCLTQIRCSDFLRPTDSLRKKKCTHVTDIYLYSEICLRNSRLSITHPPMRLNLSPDSRLSLWIYQAHMPPPLNLLSHKSLQNLLGFKIRFCQNQICEKIPFIPFIYKCVISYPYACILLSSRLPNVQFECPVSDTHSPFICQLNSINWSMCYK